MEYIDIIIRVIEHLYDDGRNGYIPIIKDSDGKELWRGEDTPNSKEAYERAFYQSTIIE